MISRTVEYALRAAVCLAIHADHQLTTAQIARETRVPAGYLAKVLQALGKAKVVKSQRGLNGGFALLKPPGELAILDIVNAVDPLKRIHRCPLGLQAHGTNLCPLHRRLDDAIGLVEKSFAEVTIEQLLVDRTGSTPLCDALSIAETMAGPIPGKRTMPHAPIERHPALQPFSRDHYGGLVQAQHLLKAADGEAADRHTALADFVQAWVDELADHFADEERLLLPLIEQPDDVQRLRDEHATLRVLAGEMESRRGDADPDSTMVRRLGQKLNDHIRWEERVLFPVIERTAGQEKLSALGKQTAIIEANRPRSQCERPLGAT